MASLNDDDIKAHAEACLDDGMSFGAIVSEFKKITGDDTLQSLRTTAYALKLLHQAGNTKAKVVVDAWNEFSSTSINTRSW